MLTQLQLQCRVSLGVFVTGTSASFSVSAMAQHAGRKLHNYAELVCKPTSDASISITSASFAGPNIRKMLRLVDASSL